MSDYTDFQAQIAEWANRQDWSTNLVSAFIRMAESKFNAELRIAQMIETQTVTLTTRFTNVPADWLEFLLVRMANTAVPDGFIPIRYKSNDEFFNLTDPQALNYYTIVGDVIHFGGAPNTVSGIQYEMDYFGQVPNFATRDASGGTSWVYTNYPSLYLYAALMHADLHAVGEEDKAANLKTLVEDTIGKLNANFRTARASGSRVTRSKVRTFG